MAKCNQLTSLTIKGLTPANVDDNAFGRDCLCLSVCPIRPLAFDSYDIETSWLVHCMRAHLQNIYRYTDTRQNVPRAVMGTSCKNAHKLNYY